MYKYLSVNFFSRIAIVASLFWVSCTPKMQPPYFNTIPYNSEIQTLITKDFEHKVKPDDILTIEIFSPSEEVKYYNAAPSGYVVDKFGNIQMYKFGDIKVQDLTLAQVKERITKKLVPDIFKEATVSVRFKNHKIVFLGQIGKPGIVPMETEHISILEAIAASGDLREFARRDNILVIRNTPKGKVFNRINLLDGSVFNSDFYYLQADDIVYVEEDPDKKKSNNTAAIIGYVTTGI